MSIFAISDLHLSFSAPEKSMEAFSGWENYVAKLKKNWESCVKPSDTVVIVGDISWSIRLEDAKEDLKFINDLPGKKILIKGNHDFWWTTSAKVKNFLKSNGFKSISILHNSALEVENVCICGTRGWTINIETEQDKKILSREVGRLRRSIEEAEGKKLNPIVFLHYPPVYGKEVSEEIMNVLIEKKIKKCYYGHIHNGGIAKNIIQGNYEGILFKLVSCDYVNFCPVLVES